MRRLVGLILIALAPALPALAQNPVSDGSIAVLPITLNTVPAGDYTVLVAESDILMSAADLKRLGIELEQQQLAAAAVGEEWTSLSALAPQVRYEFDESSFSVDIYAAPELLAETRLARSKSNVPEGILYASNPSFFANYAVSGTSFDEASLFTELGMSRGSQLFQTTLSRDADGDLRRGQTQLVIDDRRRLRRWIAGDAILGRSQLGGRPNLAGISIFRSFDLDPYFIRYPTLGLDAVAETPSTVEVYVNGTLTRRETVPPGRFVLEDLPVPTGGGDVRLLVRDAFGRETVVSSAYYLGTEVLQKGLLEYEAGVGLLRANTQELFDYGDAAGYGDFRYGLTRSLTIGGRLEASENVISGDVSTAFATRLGEFSTALALSNSDVGTGTGVQLGWRYIGRRLGAGITALSVSDEYATLTSSDDVIGRGREELTAFLSLPLAVGTTSFQVSRQDSTIADERWRYAVTGNVPLASRGSLFASGAHVIEGGAEHQEYSVGVSWLLGSNTNVGVQTASTAGGELTGFNVQRSLPTGTGYGYRLNLSEGDRTSGSAALQYQTEFGRYEVGFDPTDISNDPSFSISGAIASVGGRVLPTRAVSQSYALVRVPGVEGVRIYRSNQLIGRTDRRGELLIPDMLPYYGNDLRIEDEDIPLDFMVGDVDQLVAPPYRGGALVAFDVVRTQNVTGLLLVDKGEERVVPALGDITVSDGERTFSSPIGRDGRFWFENLPAGAHPATIRFNGSECRMQLSVPSSDEALLDLGEIACRP